jgi:LPS export ABC transporter protein LptC
MRWQKVARLGVAAFIVAFGVVVYLSVGERQEAAPAPLVERQDPTATLEVASGILTSLVGIAEDYKVSAESILSYADGSSKRAGVRITVTNRNGRDFVIQTRDARSGADEKVFELAGAVRLDASDGFWLETDTATHSRDDGITRAPGAVTFGRGRMSGSGGGMTYDQRSDLLTITEQSTVTLAA